MSTVRQHERRRPYADQYEARHSELKRAYRVDTAFEELSYLIEIEVEKDLRAERVA